MSRIENAINETQSLLNKALSYSVEFQKPAQIEFYREHIRFLRGERMEKAIVDLSNWERMNCEIAS